MLTDDRADLPTVRRGSMEDDVLRPLQAVAPSARRQRPAYPTIACGYATTNPTRGVRRNPRPKLTRFLSRAEIDRLHEALDAHRGRGSGEQQAEIIRLLLLTGCRKGEIVRVRWAEINGDSLSLTDSKTGPRTVVLNAQARAVLARQARTGSAYVFPSLTDSSQSRF